MDQEKMYNKLAKYTDLLYSDKDYRKEVNFIFKKIKNHKNKIIIDVACGSGNHSKIFQKKGYKIYGVDLNKGMLKLAKNNIPKAKLFCQDMRKLNLKTKGSILICMFNSINYNFGYKQFKSTLKRFYDHLDDKGIVVFDSLFTKDNWCEGYFSVDKHSSKNLDIARINKSLRNKDVGNVEQTYIIYENKKKIMFETANKIFLFDKERILKLMEEVGFKAKYYYDFSDSKKKGNVAVFVGVKE
jgi:ubiquinone/menaquinone biosynthesis C-methylase UbiE